MGISGFSALEPAIWKKSFFFFLHVIQRRARKIKSFFLTSYYGLKLSYDFFSKILFTPGFCCTLALNSHFGPQKSSVLPYISSNKDPFFRTFKNP